ncbi:MAG: hypothetical protein M5R42_04300 [Rhodocyclaceae bacterium]|nr:hypothetical protein [Rhodocyclaceae bacterium]
MAETASAMAGICRKILASIANDQHDDADEEKLAHEAEVPLRYRRNPGQREEYDADAERRRLK